MIEFIHTSVEKGLKTGTSGFCPVAWTEGLPMNYISPLEQMCGYKIIFAPNDPYAKDNPVSWSLQNMVIAGKPQVVLSRIGACGLDYTGRSNKIAHHILLERSELIPEGPTAYLSVAQNFKTEWVGDPKLLPVSHLRKIPVVFRRAEMWAEYAGDAGWAGVIKSRFTENPEKAVYVVFRPGMRVLPLVEEVMMLLPPEMRWKFTFNTYFVSLPPGGQCFLRFCLLDSEAYCTAKRIPGTLMIDLVNPAHNPPCPESSDVIAARLGQFSENRPTTDSVVDLSLPSLARRVPATRPQCTDSSLSAVGDHASPVLENNSDSHLKTLKQGALPRTLLIAVVVLLGGLMLFLAFSSGSSVDSVIVSNPEATSLVPTKPEVVLLDPDREINERHQLEAAVQKRLTAEAEAARVVTEKMAKDTVVRQETVTVNPQIVPPVKRVDSVVIERDTPIVKPVVNAPLDADAVCKRFWFNWNTKVLQLVQNDLTGDFRVQVPFVRSDMVLESAELNMMIEGREWKYETMSETVVKKRGGGLDIFGFKESDDGTGVVRPVADKQPFASLSVQDSELVWRTFSGQYNEAKKNHYVCISPADIRRMILSVDGGTPLVLEAQWEDIPPFSTYFSEKTEVKVYPGDAVNVALGPYEQLAYRLGILYYTLEGERVSLKEGMKIIDGKLTFRGKNVSQKVNVLGELETAIAALTVDIEKHEKILSTVSGCVKTIHSQKDDEEDAQKKQYEEYKKTISDFYAEREKELVQQRDELKKKLNVAAQETAVKAELEKLQTEQSDIKSLKFRKGEDKKKQLELMKTYNGRLKHFIEKLKNEKASKVKSFDTLMSELMRVEWRLNTQQVGGDI